MSVLIPYAIAAIATAIFTEAVIVIEKKMNMLCRDAHKVNNVRIPCIGGFALFLGLLTGMALLIFFGLVDFQQALPPLMYIVISFTIGLLDDVVDLKSRWKILLGFLPAVSLFVSQSYVPRPWIPFLGHVSISTLYPLLMFAATTVYLNAANMFDTHNGTLPVAVFSSIAFATLLKVFTGSSLNSIAIPLLLCVVVASYLPFNIYPARIFNGNSGAYLLGSLIALTAITARVEFYTILATMPMFINGFYYISSVKGFLQKEHVDRPIYVDEKGCMHAKADERAPITFVRLLITLSRGSMNEKELVIAIYTLCILTALSAFVITMTLGYG